MPRKETDSPKLTALRPFHSAETRLPKNGQALRPTDNWQQAANNGLNDGCDDGAADAD